MTRWLRRIAFVSLTLLVLAFLSGFAYEQIGRDRDDRQLPPRLGQAVDIGGRVLNLDCVGQGTPTVILENGGNSPGYAWLRQQTKMAAFTRTCWYDRAGVGWSDPPSTPRTSASIASDLHAALLGAGVLPPYVMAGSSVGGEYVRIFTARYPADVAGVILIDAAAPDMHEPEFYLGSANRMSGRTRHWLCMAVPVLARFGVLRFLASRERPPSPPDFSPDQATVLTKLEAQPKVLRADLEQACAATNQGRVVSREGGGNPEIDSAVRSAGSLGDRPLVVLTAGRYWAPEGFEKEAAEYHETWVHQVQANLVRLSTRSQQVIVVAHHDMAESPDSVVAGVRQVVDAVRARQN
jgi:pimeloyl-ACP methyl ester carboxylesterase